MNTDSLLPTTVDAENPWLGLASFTEETRAFFHGRDDDVAELARRVQRKQLTVLFGQSGHGKTSLLRAGLVPRLRPEGYCPVYVRLDYAPESAAPAEQIKAAIFRATATAGTWTKSGSSLPGETLWEFLHHRDDVLQDANGRPLIPLLIFDQFEEIFTLAQADSAGRERAHVFLTELADLVENRPPAELEKKIDRDEADAGKFDFARADYRILISLREDYLAHLEGLKASMPSVTQNRVRLARFAGPQALAAVRQPAPALVSDDVAAQIVLFVSGGTDLSGAEVEPSLLSLVCRELNNARLARRQATITADLLAGSRDTILQEFYERALADQPPGVRRFIEDELLTDSGYRENVAEERVRKGLAAAGAAPDALAVLVGRRLLRVEDRLDLRRVELTHDVLTGVVGASRATRREREGKEAAEQQLAAQREKETLTQRALWRARLIASLCSVLAVGALASAVFGYFSLRRARAAETEAIASAAAANRSAAEAKQASERMEATQEMSVDARVESEKVITYLLNDFYDELEPIGRVRVVNELAKRAVDYYHSLPPPLRTPATVRNQALALARYGAILNVQGKTDDSAPILDEAIRTFEGLKANGDKSDELLIGLALAYRSQSRVFYNQTLTPRSRTSSESSVSTIRGAATQPSASRAIRREYAEDLLQAGFQEMTDSDFDLALNTLGRMPDRSRFSRRPQWHRLFCRGGLLHQRRMVMETLIFQGKLEQAVAVGKSDLELNAKVQAVNPSDRRGIRADGLIHAYVSLADGEMLHLDEAVTEARKSGAANQRLLDLDPNNATAKNICWWRTTPKLGLWEKRDELVSQSLQPTLFSTPLRPTA